MERLRITAKILAIINLAAKAGVAVSRMPKPRRTGELPITLSGMDTK
jgi:hypothetical protein